MPKKYSRVDISFFIFIFLFLLLSIYETMRFIIPHYSFLRAIGVCIIISGAYFFYKNKFDISKIQKKFNTFTSRERHENISYSKKIAGFNKTIAFIIKNRDSMSYLSFIAMSSIFLIGMLFNTGVFLSWALGVFGFVFIGMKILGFKINTQVQKSEINSSNTIRFFLLSFALFFIIMKLICDSFAIPQSERVLLYLAFSFIYLTLGFFTFFRYKISFSGWFRPYNMLSALLVFSLVGLLAYNNGLGDVIKEKIQTKPVKQEIREEIHLPGIVSNEVQIVQKIEYEQVLVGNVYTIEAGLSLGSVGDGVSDLQKVLGNLQYFIGEVSGNFDEDTRLALVDTLRGECDWPRSTSGVFGPQAKQCIDNLEISVPSNIDNISDIGSSQEIISQEARLGDKEDNVGVLVSQVYDIQVGLSLGNTGEEVSNLQIVLGKLEYYSGEVSGNFDEDTRISLRNTLIGECEWPESTSGIFGPQAKQCIDSLKILN